MSMPNRRPSKPFWRIGALIVAGSIGCAGPSPRPGASAAAFTDVPRELQKVSHPSYRVEPPDILLVDAVNAVRPPDTVLRSGDVLSIALGNPEPLAPIDQNANPIEAQFQTELEARFKLINGDFVVQPDGTVNLGPIYGAVQVAGLTVAEAEEAVRSHLGSYATDPEGNPIGLQNPLVTVTLPNLAARQAIQGEHLVRPDGTISLGIYGAVHVAGLSVPEVKQRIETQLATNEDERVLDPDVSVDILAYNSKVVYVITDGGGYGEQVVRLPVTGNETVLDAVSQIQGLSQISSKRIWVARPAPSGTHCAQIMDVHWREIAEEGITTTNYQLFPGDRVYIQADHMIRVDNIIAKTLAPVERLFGFTTLGAGTIRSINRINSNSGSGNGNGF